MTHDASPVCAAKFDHDVVDKTPSKTVARKNMIFPGFVIYLLRIWFEALGVVLCIYWPLTSQIEYMTHQA